MRPFVTGSRLLAATLFLPTLPAYAQSAPAPTESSAAAAPSSPAADPAQVTPPVLQQYHAAVLPLGTKLEAPLSIDVELTIGTDGLVQAAKTLGDAPPQLASSVLDAVKQFRFEPARSGTTPIAVVVVYRYWLEATAPEPEVAAAPAETDIAEAPSAAPTATANTTAEPPSEPVQDETYEAVAEVAAPAHEPTRRSLAPEQLTTTAGTRGDPLRVVETLPGVGRAPDGGTPILRGAAQFESASFVDGTQLPFLFHFGGATSVIHPRLLQSVDVMPGNFGARYGRVAGGVVEAHLKRPRLDRFGLIADVNLIDSSLLVEAPVAKRTSVALAARRSNIDFVFDNFVPKDAFDVVAAPLYWDYQAIVEHEFAGGDRLRVAALGAKDELKFVFSEPPKEDPVLRGTISGRLEFHRLQFLHEAKLGNTAHGPLRQRAQLMVGLQFLDQQVGPAVATLRAYDFDTRLDWDLPVARALTFGAGIDVTGQRMEGAYRGTAAQSNEGGLPVGFNAQDQVLVDQMTFDLFNPGAYVEARIYPTDTLLLLPSIRADYAHQLGTATFDPRFTERWELPSGTTLKSGIGWYTQNPQYYEALRGIGNPDIEPYHALHTSVGAEQDLGGGFNVEAEAFYKYLYDRVVGTQGGVPPMFINDGQGRVYGIESGATYDVHGFHARGAYTLSRSERQDRDDPWRLFDQDQTHVLSLAAAYQLGAGWELSSRYRYVTGNPTTPIDGAVFDATRGVYLPHIGRLNTARDPAFSELDVRVEKRFQIGRGLLAAYLDVQNVTFRENLQGYTYSYDYSKRAGAQTMPFFPNLGLRGEL